ncbi:MAG: hypothetical protein K8S20_14455 [Chloroflexi bacterium]|nr:hypothetical protein [Chloroflexota bacterium]
MTLRMPSYLHDVFGESQSIGELVAIVLFGTGFATFLFVSFPEMTQGMPLWRSVIAYLLVMDVAAGSIANFTRSTSNYYAARDKQRLVFIAIHVHIPLLAWLLGIGLWNAVLVWGYTIAGAFIVNACKDNPFQKFVAGGMLTFGMAVIVLGTDTPKYFLVISLLFMVKVLYAFAVDHYGQADRLTSNS